MFSILLHKCVVSSVVCMNAFSPRFFTWYSVCSVITTFQICILDKPVRFVADCCWQNIRRHNCKLTGGVREWRR